MEGRITDRDLRWVDDFIASIRPHVRVRLEDNLLILVPNEAYKLNATGLVILDHLLRGGQISEVLWRIKDDSSKIEQLLYFFLDLCALVKGTMAEGRGRVAVERVPFRVPFNALPVLSEVALTYRCNLRCRFCYAACGCRAEAKENGEMTTRDVMKVLDIIAHRAKAPSVSFTGGEPTLRRDLPRLIAHARSLNLRVNLITNGTTADEGLVAHLKKSGLNSAQVSLEAATPETHERLTNVAGSFAATLRGIENLRKADIHTHTNTTINRLNLNELSGLLRLVKELGMTRLSMNMVIPTGSAAAHDEELMISYSEVGPIVRRLASEAHRPGPQVHVVLADPVVPLQPDCRGPGQQVLRRVRRAPEHRPRRRPAPVFEPPRDHREPLDRRLRRRVGLDPRSISRTRTSRPTRARPAKISRRAPAPARSIGSSAGTGNWILKKVISNQLPVTSNNL